MIKITKIHFAGNLYFEDLTDSDRPKIKLLEDFPFWVANDKGEFFRCTIPEGFVSDCASTPRFSWRITPPFGAWNKASVIHDFLCRFRKDANKVLPYPETIDSATAHYWFKIALNACKVSRFRVNVMYYSVKFFGPKWGVK